MAFTKVTAAGISSATTLTIDSINSVGVVTASTVQVGSATTIHTTGIDLGGGNITSHNINSTGIITATGAVITGNLQVDGTTTTLDTIVTEVDKLEVSANNTNVAVAVTQSGTGDILRLYDGATQAVTVNDGGNVGIGTTSIKETLSLYGSTGLTFGLSLEPHGWNNARHRLIVPVQGNSSMFSWNYNGSSVDSSLYATSAIFVQNGTISLATGTFNEVPSNRIFINAVGNVGIGTDNPSKKLDVNGDIRAVGTTPQLIVGDTFSNSRFIFGYDQSRAGHNLGSKILADGLNIGYYTRLTQNGSHIFYTNNSGSDAERLRITSTGDVVLGQGSTVGSSAGVVTYFGDGSQLSGISVGLTTEATTPSNAVTELDLTAAQDHKVTATGICTITVTGGTEADSHTIRIVNSGIATVGFSTYFLFPSGATPSLPTADGAISLISFTVHRVGLGGTQLLAGASVNFS